MFDWTKNVLGCLVAIALLIVGIFLLFVATNWLQPKRQAPKAPPVLRTAPRSPIPPEVDIEGRRMGKGSPFQKTTTDTGYVEAGSSGAATYYQVIAGEGVTVVWSTAGPRRGTWKWGVLDAAQRRVVESYPMGSRARVKTRGTIVVWLSAGNVEPYTMWFRIQR